MQREGVLAQVGHRLVVAQGDSWERVMISSNRKCQRMVGNNFVFHWLADACTRLNNMEMVQAC